MRTGICLDIAKSTKYYVALKSARGSYLAVDYLGRAQSILYVNGMDRVPHQDTFHEGIDRIITACVDGADGVPTSKPERGFWQWEFTSTILRFVVTWCSGYEWGPSGRYSYVGAKISRN